MNTKEIMDLALQLAGLDEVPEDSGIIVEGENIKKVAIGVDMELAEMLLAKDLGVDLVITHHPKGGSPMINLHKVMKSQIDRMVEAGVPINKAQKALAEKVGQVERGLHVSNYDRVVSAAKLLKMPFMGIHTPTDILAEKKVQSHLDQALKDKPKATLDDVIKALEELPEYQKTQAKPVIRVGSKDDYVGKVFVTMAGGTGGGANVAKAYFEAGVGTLVCMHMPEDVIKAVKEQNIGNVVVAGHMASDSVGINQFIKALEEKGLEVIRMSGVVNPE
ncbi:Putative GTP cyclohydrolase 1 type 2, NIF3 family [Anaerobranca californiensis DSM 14826]|jgi:putative NIF3 family GTP cyclohydrolase 1 type 2|uniref:GTP cyclohydrolase 1 type 2 homolog n=1 Tax=Anaerobranca californiensis DSM 14826 TaxID=1120989 RepID=A0A1M6QRM5_9FIRM|nr:Nif3-like dinuclear metal center hexameric protein [Anaerobranca californiensis]SHK22835.1 Putative GTP cyclohydrolase 1 type 2, NIF3 family [Anaerobranca californiensis DSM 14826]